MTAYTPTQIRCLLAGHQRMSTCRLKADLEQAMRSLPFERMQILFMAVCLGRWRNRMTPDHWLEKVGDWWGITGGQVNKVVGDALETISDALNGVAVDNS